MWCHHNQKISLHCCMCLLQCIPLCCCVCALQCIDTADFYGKEAALGAGLQSFKNGKGKHEDLFITSKLFGNYHAAADVLPTAHESLRDLQLGRPDLYLVHW